MKKLILSPGIDDTSFIPNINLRKKVARISIRARGTVAVGGGLLLGGIIVCPASLFEDKHHVIVDYNERITTHGHVLDLNHTLGLAILNTGYIPNTGGVISGDPDQRQPVQVIDHSGQNGWSITKAGLRKVVPEFMEGNDIASPHKHPGCIGGVLFDQDSNCVGIITGRSTGQTGNLYATSIYYIHAYLEHLKERKILHSD